jgi:SAM-dependent methyltransferase
VETLSDRHDQPALSAEEAQDVPTAAPPSSDTGIWDADYRENPEVRDKAQVLDNIAQFIHTARQDLAKATLLWPPQRCMYTFVRDYCRRQTASAGRRRPRIVDLGCGSGVGANVLSQAASFVWGVDKNALSIQFAREAFSREAVGDDRDCEVRFDVSDLVAADAAGETFDVVVAIEILEHVADVQRLLAAIKRFGHGAEARDSGRWTTEFFLSSPNRNHPNFGQKQPWNKFHVREWRAQELKALLLRHFAEVHLMSATGEPAANDMAEDTTFARCVHAL